jgi:hypothetical protein
MNGDKRQHDPVHRHGKALLAEQLLSALAPPWVNEKDKRRRKVRHNRVHLTHVMSCFSEGKGQIEPTIPHVIAATHALFLAGLPKDALQFVWYEHPQEICSHLHAGMVNTLQPHGGGYDLSLDTRLLLLFDRLCSRAFNLTDPIDPSRARLIHPCTQSNRKANREKIVEVMEKTHVWFNSEEFCDFAGFVARLKKDFKAVSHPLGGSNLGIRNYPGVVAIRGPERRVICFRGPVCRPSFTKEAYSARMKQREADFARAPGDLYREFEQLFCERMEEQQARYRVRSHAPLASLADFEFLHEKFSEPLIDPVRVSASDEALFNEISETDCPFFDAGEDLGLDISGPHILSRDDAIELELTPELSEDPERIAAPVLYWPPPPPDHRGAKKRPKLVVDAGKKRREIALACGIQGTEMYLQKILGEDRNRNRIAKKPSDDHPPKNPDQPLSPETKEPRLGGILKVFGEALTGMQDAFSTFWGGDAETPQKSGTTASPNKPEPSNAESNPDPKLPNEGAAQKETPPAPKTAAPIPDQTAETTEKREPESNLEDKGQQTNTGKRPSQSKGPKITAENLREDARIRAEQQRLRQEQARKERSEKLGNSDRANGPDTEPPPTEPQTSDSPKPPQPPPLEM